MSLARQTGGPPGSWGVSRATTVHLCRGSPRVDHNALTDRRLSGHAPDDHSVRRCCDGSGCRSGRLGPQVWQYGWVWLAAGPHCRGLAAAVFPIIGVKTRHMRAALSSQINNPDWTASFCNRCREQPARILRNFGMKVGGYAALDRGAGQVSWSKNSRRCCRFGASCASSADAFTRRSSGRHRRGSPVQSITILSSPSEADTSALAVGWTEGTAGKRQGLKCGQNAGRIRRVFQRFGFGHSGCVLRRHVRQ